MDSGTYTAASAGVLAEIRLGITNNNLANINTPGFKRQILVTRQQQFEDTLAKKIAKDVPFAKQDFDRNPGGIPVGTFIDFSQGSIKRTGNPLDVALKAENQFFAIGTPDGERYTKAGNFTLDGNGTIVTSEGFPVLGVGGPISINDGAPTITSGAQVVTDGGELAGQLKIVRFDNTNVLKPMGNKLYQADGNETGAVVDEPALDAGSLEMSNVSAIKSMIDLIKANRGFQMYEKTAKSFDEINQQGVSRILGR